jgi:chromosome segregation ATPase
MSEIKFTTEELAEISQIQNDYQALGIQLVQTKLSIKNAANQLEELTAQEQTLTDKVVEISKAEAVLAQELETKYGKGSIDMETGIFTPAQ